MTLKTKILDTIKPRVTPISYIWAQDERGGVGYQGELPWHLPGDMKFFKEMTWGDVVVMGRKTYESIPHPPLKNRENLILTHDPNYQANGAQVFHDPDKLLQKAKSYEKPIHIIGGATLFSMYKDAANLLICTRIATEFPADVFMPELPWSEFACVEKIDKKVSGTNQYAYSFEFYVKESALKKGVTTIHESI